MARGETSYLTRNGPTVAGEVPFVPNPPRPLLRCELPGSFIEELQRVYPLTIIRISDFRASDARTSDASNTSFGTPTPSSLEADLLHYKELFGKLRFSYAEQVSKETTIRHMVGHPPQIITAQDKNRLEARNREAKAELQDIKAQVASVVGVLEERSRELARNYEHIQEQRVCMCKLPNEIGGLEREIERLGIKQAEVLGGPNKLTLAQTNELQTLKKLEKEGLDKQLAVLDRRVPRKRKAQEQLATELTSLQTKRANSAAAAKEAKRRKMDAQAGGNNGEDELEMQGRRLRSTKLLLDSILDDEEDE